MARRIEQAPRGFTIIELIVSIAIIALLLGLAVLGMRHALAIARSTVSQTMVENVATGITEFQTKLGFLPPLVRDAGDPVPAATTLIRSEGGRSTANVYEMDDITAVRELNTLPTATNVDTNPFELEFRYSEVSLAYFVAGALEWPFEWNGPNPPTMDGVQGPGMYPPERHGHFAVPKAVRDTANPTRVGNELPPFINIGSGGLKVALGAGGDPRTIRLVDKAGVPIRYYRWVNGTEQPAPASPGNFVVDALDDLKVPRMIGRYPRVTTDPMPGETSFPTPAERDIRQNPALRTATWAVVAAGANGVFGDEPVVDIAKALGRPDTTDEVKLRTEAETDNIVRMGDGK